MPDYADWNMLTPLLATEEVIQRAHFIAGLEEQSNYAHVNRNATFWRRMRQCLDAVEPSLHAAVFALVSSTLYIPEDFRRATTRYLAYHISNHAKSHEIDLSHDINVFCVDHHKLGEELFDLGAEFRWKARADPRRAVNKQFQDVSALIAHVVRIEAVDELLADLMVSELVRQKLWVLLADNAYSGGSIRSDFERLCELRSILCRDTTPEVIIAVQVVTDQALDELSTLISPNLDYLMYALELDQRHRINSDECVLFRTDAMHRQVQSLCEWFAEVHFGAGLKSPANGPFGEAGHQARQQAYRDVQHTIEIHRKSGQYHANFAYGWKDGGYTIVDHRNSPTNSVPLLWYPVLDPDSDSNAVGRIHVAPYPRNSSRAGKVNKSLDDERMEIIRKRFGPDARGSGA